jgi:parvulin-like peptidyl-prolyl isomerase
LTTEEPGLAARESALTNGIEVLLTGARDMLKIYGEAIAAIQRASDKTLAQQWEVAAEQLRVKCVAASQEAKATADLLAAASSADSPSAAAALARTASEKARTAAGILHGIRLPSTMADSATSPQATALASAMESTRAARARLTVLLKSLGIPSASENDS